ncbi:MAG TPA: class I tRNA ligase family protein, partial [Phycisphaerales bacterium]|nr:class I tRNA ligase family protein [Phycisphaerales bacterium]
QLKAMGCSCDWDRTRFTMDEMCARAVREAFFRLFRDGLIYRGKRIVNWDPVTQTALADDEVEMEEVEGKFYYLRYPLVHKPENPGDPKDAQEVTWSELLARGYPGAEAHPADDPAWVTVATTRPETYLGDTAVAVNPRDPRAGPLRGLMAQLPIVGRIIPILEDDYVVMPDAESGDPKARYATGFLKVTPAHDPNDYELGRRHGLEMINVMAPDASISESHGWEREKRGEGGKIFVGKSREEARELALKEFHARGLLEEIRPYTHSVGHSYRSHAAIEPYLSDQWYVAVTDERLRGAALRAMAPEQRTTKSYPAREHHEGDGELRFYPERYAKTFEAWHEGLRDWCISRQLWWGHRIPVWSKTVSLSAVQQELPGWLIDGTSVLPGPEVSPRIKSEFRSFAADQLQLDWEKGELVLHLCLAPQAPIQFESNLENAGFRRDSDVLDTWFSSALWPMSTMGWPNEPVPTPPADALVPEDPPSVRTIMVKRVGDWPSFIGTEGERSGELIERLLSLRDNEPARPLVYELFSASNMTTPLRRPEDIQTCTDLVCAVGLRVREPVETRKYGEMDLRAWLTSHGFVDTAGLLEAFNPTNVLCTAREIITLWVSRMVMFNRYFLSETARQRGSETGEGKAGHSDGRLPFRDVFIHAMIQDGAGQKMSKSLGNGVDPLDIVESHGADALRFCLVKLTTQTQDVRMPVDLICPHCERGFEPRTVKTGAGHMVASPEQTCPACGKAMVTAYGMSQGIKATDERPLARNTSGKFDEARNFCNKLWNAARFSMSILNSPEEGAAPVTLPDGRRSPAEALSLPDRWILSRLVQTVAECERALAGYQFSNYATSMYDFLWRDFCDWYLEAIKPTVAADKLQRAVLAHVLEATVRLLHPIAPFITEAIWHHLRDVETIAIDGVELDPSRQGRLLATAGWPRVDDSWRSEEVERRFERVRGLVSAIREVRAQHQVQPKRRIRLHAPDEVIELIVTTDPIVPTLAGLSGFTHEEPAGPSVPVRFEGLDVRLSELADAVDAGAERARLQKAVAEHEQRITSLEKRLASPGYAERAPAHLVEQSRDQLATLRAELIALREQVERHG